MLRFLFGVGGLLSTLLLGPSLAAAAEPGAPTSALAPITLAEAQGGVTTAQAVEPMPSEGEAETGNDRSPAAMAPQPAPSPWAGTLELYGFTPLRATTFITQPARAVDPAKLFGDKKRELREQLAGLANGQLAGRPNLSFPTAPPGNGNLGLAARLPDAIELPGFTAVTDVGLGSLLEHLTDIFFLRGSVEYKRLGLQTDLSYVALAGQSAREVQRNRRLFPNLPVPTRTIKAKVAVSQGIYDFALRYRLGEREQAVGTPGALTLIPYAGVRVLDLGMETTTSFEGPLLQRSREKSFGNPIAQPLIGLQGQVFLAPRWRLFARGDLGGFGANGAVDMSGNAQAGLGYAIGNSTQLDVSWRYLYLARDSGQSASTAYTIDQNGIEIGLKLFF